LSLLMPPNLHLPQLVPAPFLFLHPWPPPQLLPLWKASW
jgi:hypothetical protein